MLRDEPKPLQALPQLERIVLRCLAKQPDHRYQTMAEIKAALEQVSLKPAEQKPSIAVLPFADMSPGKDNEWFGDGLAEEIINVLAHIPGLRVIARTSAFAFKGKHEDIRRIAETLGVANILEGSVRKAGNRIRVTAQLITAADGSHLWSERYDRDLVDIFAIQDEIATAIAGALQVKLSIKLAAHRRHEPSPEAHEAYLKARYHWGKLRPESLALTRKYLEQALALDSKYALVHCYYADHFFMLAAAGFMNGHEALTRVREEAEKALEVDPGLSEAHAQLGIVAGMDDLDWKEAERQFVLAMSHSPVPPIVRSWYGMFYLGIMGRMEEAGHYIESGLREDPLSVPALIASFGNLAALGRLDDAMRAVQKILEIEEKHPWGSALAAWACAHQERWPEALKLAEEASPMIPLNLGTLAGACRRMGQIKRAEDLVQQLLPGDACGAPMGLALFYDLCGELDRVAHWLGRALEQRDPGAFLWFSQALTLSGPHGAALRKKLNLPEAPAL